VLDTRHSWSWVRATGRTSAQMNPARQAALSSSASLQTPPCDLSLSLSKPHHNMRASQSLPKKIPVRTKVTVVQGKFLLFSLKQRMLEIPIK